MAWQGGRLSMFAVLVACVAASGGVALYFTLPASKFVPNGPDIKSDQQVGRKQPEAPILQNTDAGNMSEDTIASLHRQLEYERTLREWAYTQLKANKLTKSGLTQELETCKASAKSACVAPVPADRATAEKFEKTRVDLDKAMGELDAVLEKLK